MNPDDVKAKVSATLSEAKEALSPVQYQDVLDHVSTLIHSGDTKATSDEAAEAGG